MNLELVDMSFNNFPIVDSYAVRDRTKSLQYMYDIRDPFVCTAVDSSHAHHAVISV